MTRDVFKTDEAAEVIQSLDMVAGRRAFIKALGFGAVGAAVFGAGEGLVSPAMAQAALTDTQILNFALNLEYLESAFYSYAATGKDIPVNDRGSFPGPLTPGAKVTFTNKLVKAYAIEIADEELRHVQLLRSALVNMGGAADRPAINIGSADINGAFQQAAIAVGIEPGSDAYGGDINFLIASYIFEDVGVTAYHGAAQYIHDPDVLETAAGILAVEAYHAGIIRTSLFAQQNATFEGYTDKISALRSSLANGASTMDAPLVDDIGIGNVGAPTIVTVDAPNATMFRDLPPGPEGSGDAIAYSRSVRQVLNIVYGQQNASAGLFFPRGINPGPTTGQ